MGPAGPVEVRLLCGAGGWRVVETIAAGHDVDAAATVRYARDTVIACESAPLAPGDRDGEDRDILLPSLHAVGLLPEPVSPAAPDHEDGDGGYIGAMWRLVASLGPSLDPDTVDGPLSTIIVPE